MLVLQGNTAYQARLPQQDGLPSSAIHQFNLGPLAGLYYPINGGNCVWSMSVLDAQRSSLESSNQVASDSQDQPLVHGHGGQESALQVNAAYLAGHQHSTAGIMQMRIHLPHL